MKLINFKVDFKFQMEDLPSPTKLVVQCLFCMIVEDFCVHFTHRLHHNKYLYPYFHKVHHQFRVSIALAVEVLHPVEFFVNIFTAGGIGPYILGSHIHFTSVIIYSFLRFNEAIDEHSGYEFPWSPYRLIPFQTSAAYHDFHHTNNVGNYSEFFIFWDYIFGSNKVYYESLESKKKEDRAKLE